MHVATYEVVREELDEQGRMVGVEAVRGHLSDPYAPLELRNARLDLSTPVVLGCDRLGRRDAIVGDEGLNAALSR